MKIIKANDYDMLSKTLASEISVYLDKEDSLVCLPSGDTPVGAYNILVDNFKSHSHDIKCKFVGLDEWVGMDKNTNGSCQEYMDRFLFSPLNISLGNIKEFNAKSKDLNDELNVMDKFIKENNGLDLVVLGIGMNGHLGLNEPGTSFDSYSHVMNLDNKTIQVAQKYFENQTTLSQGITIGLKHFLESKKLILVVSGEKKKDIVKALIEGDVSENLPASISKLHHNCILIADESALSSVEDKYI